MPSVKSSRLKFQHKSLYNQPILDLTYSLPKDMSPSCHSYPSDYAQTFQIKLKSHYAKLLLKTNLQVHKKSKDFCALRY